MQVEANGRRARPFLIHSGRNEFQVFGMLLFIYAGLSLFFATGETDPAAASIPGWEQAALGGGLALAAILNIFASFYPWRDIKDGLILEIAADIGIVLIGIFYTLIVLTYVDNRAAENFVSMDLLALIAAIRTWRLIRYIRRINKTRRIEEEFREVERKIRNGGD